MQIISTREFRSRQKYYFELAEKEPVFVTRPHARPMCISPADEDLMEKPRAFDPRGQVSLTLRDKIRLTLCGQIRMPPENFAFSGVFL